MAEYDIYRQFDTLVHEKTAIYISHRLSSCQFCDKIAVFSDKELKEYGTHAELVNKPDGIYAEMFAAQAQYYVVWEKAPPETVSDERVLGGAFLNRSDGLRGSYS